MENDKRTSLWLPVSLGTGGRGQIWFACLAEMPPVCGLPCIRRTHSANMRRTSPGLRAVCVLFCYAGQCRQSMALGAIRGLCINVFRPVFSGSDRRVPHGLTLQLEMRGSTCPFSKLRFRSGTGQNAGDFSCRVSGEGVGKSIAQSNFCRTAMQRLL